MPITASLKPMRFAWRSRGGVSSSESSRRSIATMRARRSRNHGSIPELRAISSGSASRRSAASSSQRRSSVAVSGAGGSAPHSRCSQMIERPPISSERTAFCRAALERAVDRHHLAGGLHLRAEAAIAESELVERPARDLHDAVIERGLERGGGAARDRVRDLVQALARRDLGGDARDRIARCLRGQRRGARDARVDLDHVVLGRRGRLRARPGRDVRARRERELHVAAALDAERAVIFSALLRSIW